MKVKELATLPNLILLNEIKENAEIKNYYCGDLLSFIMGNAHKESTCLLTVMTSMNVIGVAVLLDFKAIIFTSNTNPSEEVIKKASDENIPLFKTPLDGLEIYEEILKYEGKI